MWDAPAHVIQVHLRVVAKATFVGATAVIVLHTVCIEALNLTIIFGDNQLHKNFPLWCQQQPLQLFWVLELLESLCSKDRLQNLPVLRTCDPYVTDQQYLKDAAQRTTLTISLAVYWRELAGRQTARTSKWT